MPNALLITADGSATPVTLPAMPGPRLTAIRGHVGGDHQLARYTSTCTPAKTLISLAVHENSTATMPPNDYATLVIEIIRHRALHCTLHGPVLLMGPADRDGKPTDLDSHQRREIQNMVATLRAELSCPEPV